MKSPEIARKSILFLFKEDFFFSTDLEYFKEKICIKTVFPDKSKIN